MNILYAHGLFSNGNSNTVKELKRLLPEHNIYAPTLSNNVFEFKTMQSNVSILNSYIKKYDINLVIGSSMGAFAVMQLSGIARILINPCMQPSQHIPSHFDNINPDEMSKYRAHEMGYKPSRENKLLTYGLFATNDELFSYTTLFNQIFYKENINIMPGGHRISPTEISNKLIPLIHKVASETKIISEAYSKFDPLPGSLLNEAFVNIFDTKSKFEYVDVVWDILELSYADIGGTFAIAKDKQELINDSDMWKMVRRNGKIVAVCLYTSKRGGRKSMAAGTDGSPEGKEGLYSIIKEDIKMKDRQAWSEVSHKMEYIKLVKFGAHPIPAKNAQELMPDKPFLSIDKDGYHYTRMIGGKPMTKIMVGNINL